MSMEHITTDTATFLKDYGGHILAFIALIQVWLIALWKKFAIKPKATVYPTANIEVGFSAFGPSIALLGTLRADNGDIFVNKMQVKVVRLHDKAEHFFSWRAFKPNEIAINPDTSIKLHIASGFLLTPKAPKQYHVFFASENFTGEYQSHILLLRDSWFKFLEQTIKQGNENTGNQIFKIREHAYTNEELFDNFMRSGQATPLHTQLGHDFFWRTGDYNIIFTVENDGKDSITNEWRITITEKDEHNLRVNTIIILREICGMPVNYHFAHKEYRKVVS